MGLKLLIADDEDTIRRGMTKYMQLHTDRFSKIYEAENGQEALDILLQYQPQVMLLDVQMPVKSGIEVLQEAKRAGIEPITIILSGYDEFKYAQQALHLGAKEYLLKTVEDDVKHDTAKMVRELETQAKEEADKKAKEYVVNAIQRCAADHVAETTISVVQLPSDEMKGRIIGREGRNIRTLETLTGVELIIDDTPEAVVLSGFDPIRREVARIALERLIVDGRIHPARIEEMVEKAQKEVETMIREEGEAAALEVGVTGIHPELIRLLGRMKFRTSYGQNALKHSVEVAQLSGLLAGEIGLDVRIAKRAGLLHDIGKSIDHDVEGSHIQIGADLCRK